MSPFQSTFVVGAITCTFGATGPFQHTDKAGAVRELSVGTHFLTELDWNTFRSLLCWDTQVIPMPWGNTVEVLVKGGPGFGTLTIPGLSAPTFQAYLVEATRTWRNVVTGHNTGTAKFIITSPLP